MSEEPLNPSGRILQSFPSHTHTNWAFTAAGEYQLTVTAHVSGNGLTATSNTAVYTFVVAPTLAIAGAESSYADGADIVLSAASTPAVTGGSYEWTVNGTVVTDQTGPQLSLTAGQDLDGANVAARLIGDVGSEIAAAPAVTLAVDEPAAPEQAIAITGLSHHYHQGSPISLSITADPAVENGSYEWFVQRVDQAAPVRVEGATSASLTLAAEQALDGAQVTARLLDADGTTELAAAQAVTIDIDDHGAAPFNEVTLSGAAEHYHTGDTAELTADVAPASVLTRWEWQVQRTGETTWTAIAGQNAASASFEVTADLEDAFVRAVLTFDDGTPYVASQPVRIEIDDHHGEEPVETTLTITGLAAHYHTGDVANLTAVQDPDTGEDHYHWFIKRTGDENYSVIAGALTANLAYEVLEGDDGAQVIARLYDHDHNVIAESAAVVIEIDDHHGEEPVETTLSISGLAHHYHTGDVANLTAVQDPDTGEDHYHWFIKRTGDENYSVIAGALTANLAYEVLEGDDGAQIIARLYDHDHAVIAESAPVVIEIDDHHAPTPVKPGEAPAQPDEDALDGIPAGGIELDKGSVEQGGTVTVQVGAGDEHAHQWVAPWLFSTPVLLGGDWAQVAADGRIAVRIPSDAAPGAHRIAVYDAAGSLIGWQAIQVTATSGGTGGAGGAGAGLAITGAELPFVAIGGAALLVLAAGAALMVARRRTSED